MKSHLTLIKIKEDMKNKIANDKNPFYKLAARMEKICDYIEYPSYGWAEGKILNKSFTIYSRSKFTSEIIIKDSNRITITNTSDLNRYYNKTKEKK